MKTLYAHTTAMALSACALARAQRIMRGLALCCGWSLLLVATEPVAHAATAPILNPPTPEFVYQSYFGNLRWVHLQPDGAITAIDSTGSLLRAKAAGARWERTTTVAENDFIVDAAMTADGQAIWTVAQNGAVRVSRNGGTDWRIAAQIPSVKLEAIALSADERTLWVAGSEGKLLRSTDGGVSWTLIPTGLDRTLFTILLTPDGQILVAGRLGQIAYGAQTALALQGHSKCPGHQHLYALAAAPNLSKIVAAGQDGYICTSVDGGRNWSRETLDNDDGDNGDFYAVTYDAQRGRFVAMGETGRIAISQKDSWRAVSTASNIDRINAMAIQGSRMVAAGAGGIILGSDDGGENWHVRDEVGSVHGQLTTVASSADGQLVIACSDRGAAYVSVDGGQRFEIRHIESNTTLALAVAAGGDVAYVGSSSGRLYEWRRGQSAWTPLAAALPANIAALATDSAGQFVIAALGDGTIWKVSDGGSRARPTHSPAQAWTPQSINADRNTQHLVIGGNNSQLLRSDDYGEHWQTYAVPGVDTVFSVSWGPEAMYATGSNGRYYTAPTQTMTWTPLRIADTGDIWAMAASPGFRWLGAARSAYVSYDDMRSSMVQRIFDGSIMDFGAAGASGKTWVVTSSHELGYFAAGKRSFPSLQTYEVDVLLHPAAANTLTLGFSPSTLCNAYQMEFNGSVDVGGVAAVPLAALRKTPTSPHTVSLEVKLPPALQQPFTLRLTTSCTDFSYQYRFAGRRLSNWTTSVPGGVNTLYIAGFALALPLLSLLLYAVLPAALLTLQKVLDADFWPGFLKPVATLINRYLLAGLLCRQHRVLAAWMRQRQALMQAHWQQERRLHDGVSVYLPLPLNTEDANGVKQNFEHPTVQDIAALLHGPSLLLQVTGVAGIGKTTMAVQLGRWMQDGSLFGHVAFPLLLASISATAPAQELARKITSVFGDDAPSPALQAELIAKRYLVPIIDRLSERGADYQTALANQPHQPGLLVITTRTLAPYDGPQVLLLPQYIVSLTLLTHYVEHEIARLSRGEQHDTMLELAEIVGALLHVIQPDDQAQRPITPLLASTFARLGFETLQAQEPLATLPRAAGRVYLDYIKLALKEIFPKSQVSVSQMLPALSALALRSVASGEGPRAVTLDDAVQLVDQRLARTDGDRLLDLWVVVGILRKIERARGSSVEFVTDTFAEVLGAYHLYKHGDETAAILSTLFTVKDSTGDSALSAATILTYISHFSQPPSLLQLHQG